MKNLGKMRLVFNNNNNFNNLNKNRKLSATMTTQYLGNYNKLNRITKFFKKNPQYRGTVSSGDCSGQDGESNCCESGQWCCSECMSSWLHMSEDCTSYCYNNNSYCCGSYNGPQCNTNN